MGLFLLLTMIFLNIAFNFFYVEFLDVFLKEGVSSDEYTAVLFLKSIAWTYMIMLPLIISQGLICDVKTLYVFIGNLFLSVIFSHLINNGAINLLTRQIFNIVQIIITFVILYML